LVKAGTAISLGYVEAGMGTFDGKGKFTVMSNNSDSIYTHNLSPTYDAGTYEIAANCRGTVTYNSGAVQNVFVYPTRSGFTFVQQADFKDFASFGGEVRRVSDKLIPTTASASIKAPFCTSKTLMGTYNYVSQGFIALSFYLETGFETFNGKGKGNSVFSTTDATLLPVLPTDNVNEYSRDFATYKIGANCQGTITYKSGLVLSVYLSPTGDSYNYVITGGLDSQVASFKDVDLVGIETRVSSQLLPTN
jgi:hypothetical protein